MRKHTGHTVGFSSPPRSKRYIVAVRREHDSHSEQLERHFPYRLTVMQMVMSPLPFLSIKSPHTEQVR